MLRKIGRYEIKAEVGRGGMSTVYRAYDPEFGRDVAIKILPHEFLHDPQFRIRFEREAKTIAALEHYAIVPLYDMGELDGQPYTVGRFMAGGTLGELIKRAPLSLVDAGKTIVRVASALDAAHVRGIIHRDLKPSNILLDQYGSVFLSDFGIARLVRSTSLTLTGSAIIGSPPYMSPEQIQGDVDLDGRSDVYALGVILFEMLTGRLPYLADSPTQAIMAHLLEPVPNLTDLHPELPKSCEEVIQKAMAKNRTDRFATAGEMAIAMQAAVFGESHGVPLYLPEDTIRMAKPLKPSAGSPFKNKGILALGGLVLLLVLLVGVWGLPRLVSSPLAGETPTAAPFASVTAVALDIATPEGNYRTAQEPIPPDLTTLPGATRTASPGGAIQSPQIFGDVDKIAFLRENNIWVMNPDGGDLIQLTNDGNPKAKLAWGDDGKTLMYIVGSCVVQLDIESNDEQNLICFGSEDQLEYYEISFTHKKALFVINRRLYMVNYDTERYKDVHFRSDLQDQAFCKYFSPYKFDKLNVKSAHWSNDGSKVAAIVMGEGIPDSAKTDSIQVFDIATCVETVPIMDAFPTTLTEKNQVLDKRFPVIGYDENPVIEDFGWDGETTFAFVGYDEDGYGPLYFYHMDTGVIEDAVNPIEGACCYRDIRWSIDGKFTAFMFKDERKAEQAIPQLYYIPYATIGTGIKYKSILLPDEFFTNLTTHSQMALRPALVMP